MENEIISSVDNPRVKAVVRLRGRRARGREESILIDGRREIARALEGGVRVREVFVCRGLLSGGEEAVEEAEGVLREAEAGGARLTEVSEAVFAKIGYGDRAEGLVATADRPRRCLADLRLSECPIVGVVEQVEKPGNLGAVLRSADGAGVEAVLAVDPVTDVYGPNVIRASLGTVFCVPVVEVTASEAIGWLKERGLSVVAADPAADNVYTDVDLAGPVGLLFGGEARGLTSAWAGCGLRRARVPMLGRADSLNVSATAALFFYEAYRQHGLSGSGGDSGSGGGVRSGE